jgi:hypothetical protein
MPKMKSYATFDDYLADQPLDKQRIIRELRAFVSATAPALVEAVKWGNGCWLKGKVPVAYVYAGGPGVQFGFVLGSRLKDPRGLLQGTAQYVRHIPLSSARDVEPDLFAPYLRQAVRETPERLSDLSSSSSASSSAKRTTGRKSSAESAKRPAHRAKRSAARRPR